MNNFLAQIILAARNSNGEDANWMQILLFLVVAVLWVLGGIIKARANKVKASEQEQDRPEGTGAAPNAFQKIPDRQAKRATVRTPQKQLRPQIQPPRRKPARAEPVVERFAAKTKQAVRPPRRFASQIEAVGPFARRLQADVKKLPEFTGKTVKKLEDKRIGIPQETPAVKYLPEILLDYSDSDSLRRAILHYEILGKPLSLRNPSEHIIGL